jgi:[ribosomal protein S5]-alanine N-acetyltransferase
VQQVAPDHPYLETDRLYLRPLVQADFDRLCLFDTDPKVRSFFPEGVLTPTQVQNELDRHLLSWQTLGFGIFAAIHKESQLLIGRCGFAQLKNGTVEMGFLFLSEYWGQGYATEAAQSVLAWGLEHIPVDRIVGFTPCDHLASRRVLEKCGMQFDRIDFYRNIPCVFYYSEGIQ